MPLKTLSLGEVGKGQKTCKQFGGIVHIPSAVTCLGHKEALWAKE